MGAAKDETSNQLSPGDMVGNYRIVRKIGAGGMGEIYEAWEAELNRRVAVKIISQAALENESVVERFKAEGRALAKLNNPHIVKVYALGAMGDHPYIAMEYIEGTPVNEFLVQHPCGVSDLVGLFRQIATGLVAAHKAGIVHRDLKPQNILVDEKYNATLIDFGIAKVYSDPASPQTAVNTFIGTLNYSAPEVLRGKTASTSSDVFSLGLVFYYMMTGDVPFGGSSQLEIIENVRSQELTFNKHIGLYFPEELKKIVLKMTAKDPEKRYINAEEVLEALKLVPTSDLPPEINATSYPSMEVKNKEEVQALCRKEGFHDSEIRFIISLAAEIQAKNDSKSSELSDKTVSVEMKMSLEISKTSLDEAIRRFRAARSKLITKQITTQKTAQHVRPPISAPAEPKKNWPLVGAVALILMAAGYGVFLKFFNIGGRPVFKPGQQITLRERLFDSQDSKKFEDRIDEVTVLESMGDRFHSKSKQGYDVIQSVNLFVPAYSLRADRKTETSFTELTTIYGDPLTAFPLKVGKKFSYRIVGTRKFDAIPGKDPQTEAWEYLWSCEVVSRVDVKIELGSFDTFKVSCAADGMQTFKRNYYYSIKLGRVVLLEREDRVKYYSEVIKYKL